METGPLLKVTETEPEKIDWGKLGLVFVGFSFLFFATAYYFASWTHSELKKISSYHLYGPIKTSESNTVLEIKIVNSPPRNGWAYVEADLLDEKNNTLMSFGGETYHESGVDGGERWEESIDFNGIRVVIPESGIYYLKFRVQTGRNSNVGFFESYKETKLTVKVRHIRGSNGPLKIIAWILLIVGVLMNEIRNLTILSFVEKMTK